MAFHFTELPRRSQLLSETLGPALGQGLSNMTTHYFANKALDKVMGDKGLVDKPISERVGALEQALRPFGPIGEQLFQRRLGVEQQRAQEQEQAKAAKGRKALAQKFGLSPDEAEGLTPEQIINYQKAVQNQEKIKRQQDTQDILKNLLGISQTPTQTQSNIPSQQANAKSQEILPSTNQQAPVASSFDPLNISDSAIALASVENPTLGNALRNAKELSLKQQKFQREEFERERNYHTGFSKDVEKEADALRSSIPKKENALDFAREAIESKEVGRFSLNKLADATGVDAFRTAKGAQLATAGKENLLTNMSRVGAKAQNIWFEQRLNSMFPKTGQSEEANLTTQEMIEGELALDKAYLNSLDKLAQQDQENYGFVKKDVKKRAHESIKDVEKEIFNRSAYRMREIEEQEKGLSSLKKNVGKPVAKGTPLTLAMAKLYYDKFKDKALTVAKENGYLVPSLDEFEKFKQNPREYREGLGQ